MSIRSLVRRNWWLVLLAVIVGAAASVVVTLREPKMYQATMQLVVGQSDSLLSSNGSVGVQTYTQSVTQLLESDVVAGEAAAQHGITPQALLGNLTVTTLPESSVLQVQYDATSTRVALATLQSINAVFQGLFKAKFSPNAAALASTGGPVTVTVFDPPHLTIGPVSPRKSRNILLGIVAGLVVGVILAITREAIAPPRPRGPVALSGRTA